MKSASFFIGVFALLVLGIACTPSVNNPPTGPVADSLMGKWVLTEIQGPGIGGPGVWSPASPAGQTLEIHPGGQLSGTAFPTATAYQGVDSITVKLIDPSQPAGYRLFWYSIDTVQHTLRFTIKPLPGGAFCIEGCGGYRFTR